MIILGSKNLAKQRAVERALLLMRLDIKCTGIAASSLVSDQPMSDEECIKGAKHRAQQALDSNPLAIYGIGIESGCQCINNQYFESGWVAIIDRTGKIGLGSSGRYELSPRIMERIHAGEELADVIDSLMQMKDVRSTQGAMGLVTNGLVNRDEAYIHGILFAFGPFVSDKRLW